MKSSEDQRKYDKEYHQELYLFCKKRGLCKRCHHEAAIIAGLCADCYYIDQEQHHAYWEKHKDERKKYYADWKKQKISAGICVNCGKRPARDGRQTCKECAEEKSAYVKHKYYQNRIMRPPDQCRWCDSPVVPGYKYCEDHLAQARQRMAFARSKGDNTNNLFRKLEAARIEEIRHHKKERRNRI